MIAKNYIELPTEGLVRGCLLDEGNAVTAYLDIKTEKRFVISHQDYSEESDHYEPVLGKEEDVKVGYAVRCLKPVSRDGFVKAAEMAAYGLGTDDELVAFRTKLATEYRISSDSTEIDEHDEFMAWVGREVDKALGKSSLEVAIEQKVADIEKYDKSTAVNGFVLNGATVWLDKATRVGLMNSTTIAKAAGLDTTTLWLGETKIDVECDKAIQLLSALEMYALECFNVTASHKKAVSELMSVDEVLAYDYTKGYPAMLEMSV